MNLQKLIEDYEPDYSIFNEDDILIHNIKKAIDKLPIADKIIFLLYVEYQSLRKVGKLLGVSHSVIYKEINRIKAIIHDSI